MVVATGMQTEMGRIAGLLKQAPQETTPLQKELARIGKLLGLIVVVIAVVMIATIILVEHVSGFAAIFDVLILGVALAVAAVPEGLPAVVTAVLSLGVQRMARRNAIVRHLAGGGNARLGECHRFRQDRHADKERDDGARGGHGERPRATGRQRLRAGRRSAARGKETGIGTAIGRTRFGALRIELERALAVADRANNAVLQKTEGAGWSQGDPTEGALIVAARKAGLEA